MYYVQHNKSFKIKQIYLLSIPIPVFIINKTINNNESFV